MKKVLTLIMVLPFLFMTSCSDDDDGGETALDIPTGDSKVYILNSVSDPAISGTATFIENESGQTTIELQLTGTPNDGMHPAHIHFNSSVEGGDIALTLGTVEGESGFSTITTGRLDDGTVVSYDEFLDFDGYINVHLSANDLTTLVAQGDIGGNELNGTQKVYDLKTVDVDGISGTATFEQRKNGTALATLSLMNTIPDAEHPAHIHMNTAAEGGGIVFTFNPVNGTTGMSVTNVAAFDEDVDSDEEAFLYEDILEYDGYINVHLGPGDDLATIVAQGDIGQNELNGESKTYDLGEKDVPGISGTVVFEERLNGEALATLSLVNTIPDAEHPAHIHMNTAAEGGDIAFTFNPVDGTTGMSVTNVAALDNEDDDDDDDSEDVAFLYEDVLDYDGYVNVHLGPGDDLATIVAQGDIGQNELNGESKTYDLGEKDVPGISGTVVFEERLNGEALATLSLMNTIPDAEHPAHIHMNTAVEGGDIAFTFNSVDGTTGMSVTNVAAFDDEDDDDSNDVAFLYDDILNYDGYVNVHLGPGDDLATIVAQGDIGQNELTDQSISYALATLDVPGINGTVTFTERVNGEALAVIELVGTIDNAQHPAHIHAGSVATAPGAIIFSFNPVDGTSGISETNVTELDDETNFGYSDVLNVDGYVNVHLGPGDDLATIVAQGNVGVNAN